MQAQRFGRDVGLAAMLVTLAALLVAATTAAQVPDHLKCYKIRDPLLLAGTVDADSPQFGADAGCTISKAKLFCVPATNTNVAVRDRRTGPITPLPASGPATEGARICYKLKCPGLPPDQQVTDQFGTRTLSKFKSSLLCTPAVTGAAYCGDETRTGSEECDGIDLGGATCLSEGFASGTLVCGSGCRLDTSGCVASTIPGCGNGVREGAESCDGSDLGGATCVSLGYRLGGLVGCTTGCAYDITGCASQALPATGQTTCWDTNETMIPCAGTGQDGELRKGARLAYVDNGDGTITDQNTGLMWEKFSDDGSIHDKDNVYTWLDAFAVHVGTLNGTSFAGHGDWRVPNIRELQSIVDFGTNAPAISPAFNTGCTPACTVQTCSCTNPVEYYDGRNNPPGYCWSSDTAIGEGTLNAAWTVHFYFGNTNGLGKSAGWALSVRAVRGGP